MYENDRQGHYRLRATTVILNEQCLQDLGDNQITAGLERMATTIGL